MCLGAGSLVSWDTLFMDTDFHRIAGGSTCAPVTLVGFGVFLLFQKKAFCSRAINVAARGSFAVYLVTEYPPVRKLLWSGPFDLGALMADPSGFFVALGLLLGVYLGCTAFDLVRQQVFKATVDPLWNRGFEVLYGRAQLLAGSLLRKLGDCSR